MKTVFVGINSKFSHTSLSIRCLRSVCKDCEIAEYTINHNIEDVVADIYDKDADVYGFSAYIFNIESLVRIVSDLRLLKPGCTIFVGGPEVSYCSESFLRNNPAVDFVCRGEGENALPEILPALEKRGEGEDVLSCLERTCPPSVSYIYNNEYKETQIAPSVCPLDKLIFPYTEEELTELKDRILYYESTRGCPFGCSYCLSSVDRGVRAKSLEKVFSELSLFLQHKVGLVKFVDRTFNYDRKRALAIIRFLKEHDNGITCFHFEVAARLLDDETIAELNSSRKHLFQLEAGIQSTNPQTLKAINRKEDFEEVEQVVLKLCGGPVPVHVDLIAGLPFEDYKTFGKSFNDTFRLFPDCLQLGFLKVLKGAPISYEAEHENVYSAAPPYEILYNKYISFDEMRKLKRIETVLELYYNSGLAKNSVIYMTEHFFDGDGFAFFEVLSEYWKERNLYSVNHKSTELFEILYSFFLTFADSETSENFIIDDMFSFDRFAVLPAWAEYVCLEDGKLKDLLRTPEKVEALLSESEKEVFNSMESRKWYRNSSLVKFTLDCHGKAEERNKLYLYGKIRRNFEVTL